MIIVMRPDVERAEVAYVRKRAESLGLASHVTSSGSRTTIGLTGELDGIEPGAFEGLAGVEEIRRTDEPFRLASNSFQASPTVVRVGGRPVGGQEVVVMAGPCSVESRAQILEAARSVKEAGATVLRGGAFKPRTSPYSFQGLYREGLELLAEARSETGLAIVTEVMAPEHVPLVSQYADLLQIGARNMQNHMLLRAAGEAEVPVLLKRGMMSTVRELLLSAEYILARGNSDVILCERGIRTFESYTRNTLDINAVPLLKKLTHLPVIVDPSHATGRADLVPAVSRALVAAGADGMLVEVHPSPETALSDGEQSLTPARFSELLRDLRGVARAVGRSIRGPGRASSADPGARGTGAMEPTGRAS